MTSRPCSHCDAPSIKSLALTDFCGHHLADLYGTFDPAVFDFNGKGLPTGPPRPDHGHNFTELTCCACQATWVGQPGDPCQWCARSYQTMLEHQADLVLQPPDVDPDDTLYIDRMKAWAERLTRAVEAGIITSDQGQTVWTQHKTKAA